MKYGLQLYSIKTISQAKGLRESLKKAKEYGYDCVEFAGFFGLTADEVCEELKKNGFESISEGTLFPLLLRLEARGLFNTRKKANPLGPSRKYYSLNENGEIELEIFMEQWKSLKKKINFIFGDADE